MRLFVKVKIELLCAFTGDMSKGEVSGCWRQVADKDIGSQHFFQMSFDCDAFEHMILKIILSPAFLWNHKGEINLWENW